MEDYLSACIQGTERTSNALEQTLCEILDMPFGKRLKRVLLEEVEHAHPVQLGYQTRVITKIKMLVKVDAVATHGQHWSEERKFRPT